MISLPPENTPIDPKINRLVRDPVKALSTKSLGESIYEQAGQETAYSCPRNIIVHIDLTFEIHKKYEILWQIFDLSIAIGHHLNVHADKLVY